MVKWYDKRVGRVEYNFVEKPGTKLCGNYGKKKVLENCVEKLVGRVGWEDWVKGAVEKCC